MKRAVEFHDSRVGSIKSLGNLIEVELAPAYVHQTAGEPGRERVTGWSQPVRLTLQNASVKGKQPVMPCRLSDGQVRTGDGKLKYLLPLPYEEAGNIEIRLQFDSGEEIVLTAMHIELQASGEPEFVEEFHSEKDISG